MNEPTTLFAALRRLVRFPFPQLALLMLYVAGIVAITVRGGARGCF